MVILAVMLAVSASITLMHHAVEPADTNILAPPIDADLQDAALKDAGVDTTVPRDAPADVFSPSQPIKDTVTPAKAPQPRTPRQIAPTTMTMTKPDLHDMATGEVHVLSDAPGARTFVDGTDMGQVPVDIKEIKAGDHLVQVRATGFQPSERHVTIIAGDSQIAKFDLTPEASSNTGLVKVVSTVPEAMVFIDGAQIGKVPLEKRLVQGDHPVVVRSAGHKQFEQKVRIGVGQTVTVQADLKAVGGLRVQSTPAKAMVMINGLPAGLTPLEVEVEVGERAVRIEQPGFVPFEKTVTIRGGKTETLWRELAPAMH
jgi:hypothetical protein